MSLLVIVEGLLQCPEDYCMRNSHPGDDQVVMTTVYVVIVFPPIRPLCGIELRFCVISG